MSSMESMYTAAVMFMGRTLHRINFTRTGTWPRGEYGGNERPRRIPVDKVEDANLISSLLGNMRHAPAIDLDFPAYLVPSSTPGHFHLYIEKEMSWTDYKKLLTTMMEVGLIEKKWYDLCVGFEQTFLRLPHIKKEVQPVSTSGFVDDY